MNDDTRKAWAQWLLVAAKILSYFASALVGGVVAAGCKNGALINLCSM